MDELRAFFNSPATGSSQKIKLRGPRTAGRRITKTDTINELNRSEEHRHSILPSGTDYAIAIKQKEEEMYLENQRAIQLSTRESDSEGLNSLEPLSSTSASQQHLLDLTDEVMTHVYNKYSFQRKEDTKNLAINEYHEEIIKHIHGFDIVVIEGPTGCGKTTQVPQWILDDAYNKRKACKIVVTQPRKIAAISIAKRVAQERGWDVGGIVGYQVALENTTSNDTRITYVTTGVLLQKLVNAKHMNEYTHIILDEVHERGQEMDFLLLVVKRFLYTVSPKVKIILMSATFNVQTFTNFFSLANQKSLICATIKVEPGRPRYKTKTFYLNNLTKFGELPKHSEPPEITQEMNHLVVKLVNTFENMDKQEEFDNNDISEEDLPSVLIFLPGINEIEELYSCLTDPQLRKKLCGHESAQSELWVLPLHSTITADEQVRVFHRTPPGHRKVILATNIAESSITVPDIKYVIDYCMMKVLVADVSTNFTSLQLMWASKANCDQRAGRAGRVRDGRVYRLVRDSFYHTLNDESTPEMSRCPLERLVLLAKTLDMGPPSDILALAMDPPDMSNIHRTILVLKEVGALKKTINDEWSSSDGDITDLGRLMAALPLDIRMSKLIMLGYIFGCLDESVIMAAAMSVKNVFSSPFRERMNAYNSKLTWADGSTSDCIALLNVYKVWSHLRQQQYFKQAGNTEAQWARRFYVQVRAMRELDDTVRDLRRRLDKAGLTSGAPGASGASARPAPWGKGELPTVLKVILAGAFYPQYFVQLAGDEGREREAVRTLDGLDPRTSVYLRGFPPDQPPHVYAAAVRDAVRAHVGDEPRVSFDKTSRKIYLTFDGDVGLQHDKNKGGDPTIPGQVLLPVYKAVKARHLQMPIRLPLLPLEKANALAAAAESLKLARNTDKMVPRLPEIDDTYFPLKISQLLNIGRFWVQYADESTDNDLRDIHDYLNRKPLVPVSGSVAVDTIVAAPYQDDEGTKLYRARVTKVLPRDTFEVFYIDYGSIGRVGLSSLRILPQGECTARPPLAMQCALAELAPAPLLHTHPHWAPAALRLFTDLVAKGRLIGKVYSVTHGVVAIELMAESGKININKELLAKGYAVPCEESYDSKLNHDLRETATELNIAQKRAYNAEQSKLACHQTCDIAVVSAKECISDVLLKGPISPLETTLHNIMYAGRHKLVSVERSSVNSVLLDTEPQELYERLLVAAEVGQNANGSMLTLRHTTLMPNIPGLPAILALLFCPVAELRRDAACTRYVSVLCGLGSDEDGQPHFPEHDLLVDIDAQLTVEDIGLINHIRYLMDYTLLCTRGGDVMTDKADYTHNLPKFIREDLMKLLPKRRKYCEPESVANAWEWRSVPEHEFMEITVPEMVKCAELFPLHAPLDLVPVPRERLLQLKRDNDELKLLLARGAGGGVGAGGAGGAEAACALCGSAPMAAHALRLHLLSNAHREKEEDFGIFQS